MPGGSSPRQRQPGEDVLAGRWNAQQGAYYQFVKQGDGVYEVTEQSILGRTGGGTATVNNNTVTLDLKNMIMGQYRVQLELSGDVMRGTVKFWGMPVPFVLTRG